jgi:hypothetical protein
MQFRYLFLIAGGLDVTDVAYAQGLGAAHERAPVAIQATCAQSSGEKQLSRLSASYIEIRSGSSSRSVPIADIASIDVTGPVNRANRFAWATVRTASGQTENVGIVLPNAGTLLLDGVNGQGKADSIDLLDCKSIAFTQGTLHADAMK